MTKLPFKNRRLLAWCVTGCALLSVSGCTSLGPTALHSDRSEYNRAIQQTEQEELLLNIVRLRYDENIKFLQVGSIVSSLNRGASVTGPSIALPFGPHIGSTPSTASLGTGFSYTEAPTITYVPVEGQQFATQFLSSVSVNTMQLLLQSGWNLDQVMALLVNRMGPLVNYPGAASFSKFMELINIWRKVQDRGDLRFVWFPTNDAVLADNLPISAVNTSVFNTIGTASNALRYNLRPDGKYQLVQSFDSVVMELRYATQAEADQVSAILGSVSTRPKGSLVEHVALASAVTAPTDYSKGEPVTQLAMSTRSLADMLYSVTAGVEVPSADGGVVVAAEPGTPKLINIHRSEESPMGAFVTTQYRGHWFAVSDTDVDSKTNFQLLLNILSLQTAAGGSAPGLTLSVGH